MRSLSGCVAMSGYWRNRLLAGSRMAEDHHTKSGQDVSTCIPPDIYRTQTKRRTTTRCALLLLVFCIILPATASSSGQEALQSRSGLSSHRSTHKGRLRGRRSTAALRRDRHGRIRRSSAAKHAFERQDPCPSTSRTNGRCPGYVIDHVRPLECGGADLPSNMQWQTIAAAKAKDKTESRCR